MEEKVRRVVILGGDVNSNSGGGHCRRIRLWILTYRTWSSSRRGDKLLTELVFTSWLI